MVNYCDRSALAIANPLIRRDLHLSLGQMGLLLSAFAWSYGAAQIPAGALAGRIGGRRALGFGLLAWSAAQSAAALTHGFASLFAARLALGVGESPLYLAGTSLLSQHYPPKRRAIPIALFNASASLGPAIAPLVLTALILGLGWRAGFALLGALGVLVAAAWFALPRGPAAATPAHPPSAGQLWRILRARHTLPLTAAFAGVIYASWLFATWLPGYLEHDRHLPLRAAGLLSGLVLGAGFLGALLAGPLIRALQQRSHPVRAASRTAATAMAATAGFTLLGAAAHSLPLALALLSGGVFAANCASSAGWLLGAVLVPPEDVAVLESVQNVGGSLGGALAPALTGYAAGATGNFFAAFALAALIALATAVLYFKISSTEQTGG